jgi:GntR family transcriptional regulator
VPALINIDTKSGVPIYQQIIADIRRSINLNVLVAGEQLPSVKQMALNLNLNPNTVARCYRELEKDGTIETSGRGSFIRAGVAKANARNASRDALHSLLMRAVREAKLIGLSSSEVEESLAEAIRECYSVREIKK